MAVKFEIYRDGARIAAFLPVAAMAIGPESVPISGTVSFKDGLLSIERGDEHALGVALLWDIPGLGAYHLETTRLAQRAKPYNLNVELARFRLMKIVQKQEDWNLFDFPKIEKYQETFRTAQNLFADALGKLSCPADASRLADKSLAMALELSEQLSAFHADLLINRRRTGGAFVKHIFGARVDSTVSNQKCRDTVAEQFDYAVVPLPWKQIQPEEAAFKTDGPDEWIEQLNKKKIPVIAGPIISLEEDKVPDWLFIWEHDFDTLRDLSYEYVQRIVQRYRRNVSMWNVAAGLNANTTFPMSFEQVIELTRLLVAQVKTAAPGARTLITITQPFGEYHATAGAGVPPMLYAEMIAQAGINFEAFGLELQLGVPSDGSYVRDLFQLSCLLDRFSTLGRPVFLTAVTAPGRSTPDPADASEGTLDPMAAGRWKRPWDPQLQADWLEAVYRLALSKPFVESIAWGDVSDAHPSIAGGGLLDDMLKPKPAFTKLQELRTKFHSWSRK